MSDPLMLFVYAAVGCVLMFFAVIAGYVLRDRTRTKSEVDIEEELLKLETKKSDAEKQALEILRKAEHDATKEAEERKSSVQKELARMREEAERNEARLKKREEQADRRDEGLSRREGEFDKKEKRVDELVRKREEALTESERIRVGLVKRSEEIAGMSAEEAKKLLLQELEKDVHQESAALIRRIEQETKEQADKKSRQILTLAIQKSATEHVSETTVSVVNLPNDEMKGRIIGREGRNIRTLEQLTGVNFIVDDTPEAIVLSCFDPMRREIARIVLEKLMADGRIHPSRIEELVEKTEKQVLDSAREAGEAACLELRIYDIHPELVKLMGRLKYRTSYGQNVLHHSVEVARIAEVIASELGLDAQLAKRAAFLHDIGKAMSYEVEGPHAAIGAELAKKHRERQEIVHAIEAHHFEVEPRTLTAMLVITADSVSAARPGARRESLESYIKRLEQLETICNAFPGVEKAYAVQAGREVRVVVQPEKLNDNECSMLARDISKKIEAEMQYPGQIKVTVLRETRNVEFAR
ncbi:ribonuclease Y [Candidatus Sumerlaeota bacterium]|nr:ribonuclease Y [Candidatus Sumerlaeota bacterium]